MFLPLHVKVKFKNVEDKSFDGLLLLEVPPDFIFSEIDVVKEVTKEKEV